MMDRTDGIGNCSITVHLRQTQQVSGGGVLFEACRVGSVNKSDGSITLNWDLGQLNRLRPSDSTYRATEELSRLLFEDRDGNEDRVLIQDVETRTAVTGEDGTCRFPGLEEGAWLIHASDSSSYGMIEDTLAAVPCYVQDGSVWTGPVYNPDIWPKGDITRQDNPDDPETDTSEKNTQSPPGNHDLPDTPTQETVVSSPGKNTPGTEKETTTEAQKPPESRKHRTPETEKVRNDAPGGTIQRTQEVRTLDETPLSSLLCVFVGCAVIIPMLISRLRKRTGKHGVYILIPAVMSALVFSAVPMIRSYADDLDSLKEILEGEQHIVFENESPGSPCISVSKEVLDAENGSRAPSEDRFIFRLSLDGERAGNMVFRVFDESGQELVDITGGGTKSLVPSGSVQGDPVLLRTGRDGSFSLAAGQYAVFEDVSAGTVFEVEELPAKNYERVVPKTSGVVSGTVGSDGSSAEYINRYVPDEDIGSQDGMVEITKHILWPENADLPQRGTFRMRVIVDDVPLKNARIELYDGASGAPVFRYTDEDGVFEIEGGQRAVIKPLPSGSDLYIEEIDDPDDMFVPYGSTVWKGSVTARGRAVFTNRLADFAVRKELRGNDIDGSGQTADDSFRFCLSDGNGSPAAGVSYYLIAQDGSLADMDTLHTGPQGHFSLKAGQRAVFCGMEEGTGYSIREEMMMGYRQVMPENENGYVNQVVKSGVPELVFGNERTSVKLPAASAGGPGIAALMAAAAAGMIISAVFLLHGREHFRGNRR